MALGPAGLLALLLAAALAGPAEARPGSETSDELRAELLRGRTEGDWNSTLRLLMDRPAEQIGETLGPLFTSPEPARRIDLLATVGACLAAHPVAGAGGTSHVLLAELILRRALEPDGAAYLERLQRPMETERGPNGGRRRDWDRLLDEAVEILGRPVADPLDRQAAIAFLALEEGRRADDSVRALRAEAQRQAAAPAAAGEPGPRAALLEALDRLLAVRFASPAEAAQTLEAAKDLSYPALWRQLSHGKDARSDDRRLLLKYLREAVARADSASALAQVVSDSAAFPEVLHEAIARAATLKPRPGLEWSEFFVKLLQLAPEPDLVDQALDLLAGAGFGGGPGECCSPVADAIQRRLVERRPPDPSATRVRLVATLGDLASLDPVVRQVGAALGRGAPTEVDTAELAELALAVGKCPGAQVDVHLRPFYALPEVSPAMREALRTAVVRALGREGVRAADADAAVVALTSVLEGGEGWERASSPKVREAALRSLGAYPRAATASLLLGVAQAVGAGTEDESQLALQTLGKMMTAGDGGHHGASALVAFLRATAGRVEMEARRLAALKRFKELPAGEGVPADVRAAVGAVLSEVLAQGTEGERTQAARTAADLADPTALRPLTAWWAEQPAGPRAELLRELLEAVVRAPAPKDPPAVGLPDPDAFVAEALAAVSQTSGQEATAVEWAEILARSGVRAGAPRLLLVVAQAQALLARAATRPAGAPGAESRVADLSTARSLLEAAHQAARASEEAEQTRRLLIATLEGLGEALGPGEETKAALLRAVELAARSTVTPVLQAGDRLGHRLLSEQDLRRLLTAEEQADLGRRLDTIREALAGRH